MASLHYFLLILDTKYTPELVFFGNTIETTELFQVIQETSHDINDYMKYFLSHVENIRQRHIVVSPHSESCDNFNWLN